MTTTNRYSVKNRYFVKINYRPNAARTLTEYAVSLYNRFRNYAKTTPAIEDYSRFGTETYKREREYEMLLECCAGLRNTNNAGHDVKDALVCTRKALNRYDGYRLHPTWYDDTQREELEKLVAFQILKLGEAIDKLASIFDDELDVRFL